MLGFFRRGDGGVTPVAPGTPVDRVSFTAQEVYAILGDVDLPIFICNTTTMELLRPALIRPDEWRRGAVARLAPAGIVDDACNPCPELERLLGPLRERGVEVSDGVTPLPGDSRDRRSFCLCGTYGQATLIRSRGNGLGRTFTLEDAGPREGWWAHVARAAGIPPIVCSGPAESVPYLESGEAGEGLADSLMRGDIDRVRAFANRWGADPDRLTATSSAISAERGRGLVMCPLRVIDATGSEVELLKCKNFTMHKIVGGEMYGADARLFPSFGFAMVSRYCRRAGMPDDWYSDSEVFSSSLFNCVDWLGDGDLVAHLMSNPPFPEHLTTPWRPSGGE